MDEMELNLILKRFKALGIETDDCGVLMLALTRADVDFEWKQE